MSDIEVGNVLKIGNKFHTIDTILRVPERITIALTLGTKSDEENLTALTPPDKTLNRLCTVEFPTNHRLWVKNPKKAIGQLFSGKSEGYIDIDDIPFFFHNTWVRPGENNAFKGQAQDMESAGINLVALFRYETMTVEPWEGKSERPDNFTVVT